MCGMCSLHSIFCFAINRKKQPQKKNKRDKTHVQLDDISRSSVDATATSTNPVYQNVADIQQHHQGNRRCYFSMHSTKALREFLFLNSGIQMPT